MKNTCYTVLPSWQTVWISESYHPI